MWYFFCVDEIGIHGAPLVVDGAELWFVPDKNLSYQEATSYCQKNDSDLASIESYPKLRTILSQIEKVRGYNLFSQLLCREIYLPSFLLYENVSPNFFLFTVGLNGFQLYLERKGGIKENYFNGSLVKEFVNLKVGLTAFKKSKTL